MASNHKKTFLKEYDRAIEELVEAKAMIKELLSVVSELRAEVKTLKETIAQKDDKINVLVLEIERLKNNNNKDSSNSNMPSSKNGLKKVLNSREKTNKKQGGQVGHKGNTTDISEIKMLIDSGKAKHNIIEIHKTIENQNKEYKIRYVQDIEISTVINEYHYYPDENGLCGIPKEQSNVVTYGSEIKAISMLLVHRVPASMDQSVNFLNIITNGNFKITKSTLNNWTFSLSIMLEQVLGEIKQALFDSTHVNTDESPVNVDGKNCQLHNYSNEKFTLQYIHTSKSKAAIAEIGFLTNYIGTLIHDHNITQYNYGTKHGECNAHILRYLKANTEFAKHEWSTQMSYFLKEILHHKHSLLESNILFFDKEILERYSAKYDEIIKNASQEFLKDYKTNPFRNEEENLINRLDEYKSNHLLFMYDFSIPFTNNRAETDIRPVKRKLNVGIFRSQDFAGYYLRIRSFISTFLKNDLNIFQEIKNAFDHKIVTLNVVG